MADETEAPAAPPEKSGGMVGKLVSAIGILVIVIAGNIVTNIVVRDFMPGMAPLANCSGEVAEDGNGKSAAADEPVGPAMYLALDPPLVASIDDGQAIRFVQITVEVMARDQATLDAVTTHTPVIRNNLLMLLGRKSVPDLTNSEGKELLRAESLKEVQAILERMGPIDRDNPGGGLEDLYFTSFVVQ